MINFRKKLLVLGMIFGVSVSLFAQKGSDNSNQRPKKEPSQIVVKEKPQKPPPSKPSDKPKDKP